VLWTSNNYHMNFGCSQNLKNCNLLQEVKNIFCNTLGLKINFRISTTISAKPFITQCTDFDSL
jgi:hypothetical protein